MTARNQNVKIYRGNTQTLAIAVTQADGSAYDPSLNAIIRWKLAKTPHSDPLAWKSLADGITVVTGGVEVVLDKADTDFPPGIYYHELKVWDVNDVSTAMVGAFIIKPALPMDDGDPREGSMITYPPTVAVA